MRVSLFISCLLALSLQLSALHSNGQNIEQIEVTLEFKNARLSEVIREIQNKTGINFVYSPDHVNAWRHITVEKEKRTVKKLLDLVLGETTLTYKEEAGTVVILKKKTTSAVEAGNRSGNKQIEPTLTKVTGTVKDRTGVPLPGVNVVVKGTTRGTSTDSEGKFTMDITEGEVLVFSFIGYKTYEVSVNLQTLIEVIMEEDVAELREVVISGGYYSTTDKLKTGTIVKVESKDIENQPVTSPLMALQGRVPGLDITSESGVPGNAPKIRIRGENSLRPSGGYPLYIVDGVQLDPQPLRSSGGALLTSFDPLSTINPSNIERIVILKDADATAIYGSRGSNGVILITTKAGKQTDGKTSFDFNIYRGVGKVASKLKLLDTEQFLKMRKEAFANDGVMPDETNAPDLIVWDTTRYTDWQKVLIGGTSNITDVQANISTGTLNTSFRFGGGYHKETLVFPGDFQYQRATVSFSLNHLSTNKKFNASLAVNYGIDENDLFSERGLINDALTLAPNAPPLHDGNGNLNWAVNSSGSDTWINPLSYLERAHDVTTNNLVANCIISYELFQGLTVKSSFGFTDLRSKELLKTPFSSMSPQNVASSTAENTFGNNNRQSWVIEPQLDYIRNFGGHTVNVLLGSTWQRSTSEYQSILAQGYTSDELLGALQWAATTRVTAEGVNEYKYNSLFGRIGYNYLDKYLVNFTARRDGSSRFGPNSRFGNFGAVGIGWIFSSEGFVSDNLSFLSFGKLRGSYGITGNDQIGDYQFYDYYIKTYLTYDGKIGVNPNALFNPNYKWEETEKLEVALQLAFFNNRLSLEADFYRNRSDNQLINYQLPSTTGFTSIFRNFDATVENRGLEFQITSENILKSQFSWTTSINFTVPRNRLIAFQNIEKSPYATTYKVGESLGIQRLFNWQGVNPETGLYQFEDIDDNGEINDNDLQFMFSLDRKFYGGLVSTFQYKSLELSFLLYFSHGMAPVYYFGGLPGRASNQPVTVLERWENEGDVSSIQKFSQDEPAGSAFDKFGRSNRQYISGSFLRLKTLSLSYRIPSVFLSKVSRQEARIYVQGQNLFAASDYETLDPETGTGLPPLKMLTVGFQIKF